MRSPICSRHVSSSEPGAGCLGLHVPETWMCPSLPSPAVKMEPGIHGARWAVRVLSVPPGEAGVTALRLSQSCPEPGSAMCLPRFLGRHPPLLCPLGVPTSFLPCGQVASESLPPATPRLDPRELGVSRARSWGLRAHHQPCGPRR